MALQPGLQAPLLLQRSAPMARIGHDAITKRSANGPDVEEKI